MTKLASELGFDCLLLHPYASFSTQLSGEHGTPLWGLDPGLRGDGLCDLVLPTSPILLAHCASALLSPLSSLTSRLVPPPGLCVVSLLPGIPFPWVSLWSALLT